MSYLPTLRQLTYLIALRDHLHFGRAAEQCHVTQSTLSAGIQELENLLGASLVERTKRSVLFTPLGDEVVEKAQRVVREAQELADLAAGKEPLSGRLKLGVIPTIAPFLLPKILPRLRKAHPLLSLELKEDFSHLLCDDLIAGRLDLILFALPFRCGDVEQEILFEDPFFAAFPPGTAGAAGGTVSPDSLAGERLLLLEEGHCLRDHALDACSSPMINADRSIMGTSLHTLVQMVANGLGVTLLPKMAIDGGILRGTGITVTPLSGGKAPSRKIGLVWRKQSPRQEEFRLLADFIRKHAPES